MKTKQRVNQKRSCTSEPIRLSLHTSRDSLKTNASLQEVTVLRSQLYQILNQEKSVTLVAIVIFLIVLADVS